MINKPLRTLTEIIAEKRLLLKPIILPIEPVEPIKPAVSESAIPETIVEQIKVIKPIRSLADIIKQASEKLKEAKTRNAIIATVTEATITEDAKYSIASKLPLETLSESNLESLTESSVESNLESKVEFTSLSTEVMVRSLDKELPLALFEPASKETFSLDIVLNENQLAASELAMTGKSFVLVGAAGTGKTSAQRAVAKSLLLSGSLGTHTFKIQGMSPAQFVVAPSIAFVAQTQIASGNLRKAICKDPVLADQLYYNVTTIHNLLEYVPETYLDFEGTERFRFAPKRTASNPLDITHLVLEEASLVDLTLWGNLIAALNPGVQIIFIGDINQLPPVFGPSILNYALSSLPVIELTHVYRQAGDSLVLENAHRILEGRSLIEGPDFEIVRCGTTQHSQEKLGASIGQTFPKWQDAGKYDPEQDIILSPWGKQDLGTDAINKWIAQHLGTKRNAVVHEVIAGITKLYLAVGDKVLYRKQAAYIEKISINVQYVGKKPKTPGTNLTRFGGYVGKDSHELEDSFELAGYTNLNLDQILAEDTDFTKIASHIVDIKTADGQIVTLTSVGDYSPSSFTLGYALTVHKAQGCEWRKVFLILHKDHAVSLFRELLYTAVTRARESVVIIAKDTVIDKAIKTQRLKGNTLKDKIEFFNAGLLNADEVRCTP